MAHALTLREKHQNPRRSTPSRRQKRRPSPWGRGPQKGGGWCPLFGRFFVAGAAQEVTLSFSSSRPPPRPSRATPHAGPAAPSCRGVAVPATTTGEPRPRARAVSRGTRPTERFPSHNRRPHPSPFQRSPRPNRAPHPPSRPPLTAGWASPAAMRAPPLTLAASAAREVSRHEGRAEERAAAACASTKESLASESRARARAVLLRPRRRPRPALGDVALPLSGSPPVRAAVPPPITAPPTLVAAVPVKPREAPIAVPAPDVPGPTDDNKT